MVCVVDQFLSFVAQFALRFIVFCFCLNDTATTEIYTLSLHDALPISDRPQRHGSFAGIHDPYGGQPIRLCECSAGWARSEEHTSELQSLRHLVCRLLLEKKKTTPMSTAGTLAYNVPRELSERSPGSGL